MNMARLAHGLGKINAYDAYHSCVQYRKPPCYSLISSFLIVDLPCFNSRIRPPKHFFVCPERPAIL